MQANMQVDPKLQDQLDYAWQDFDAHVAEAHAGSFMPELATTCHECAGILLAVNQAYGSILGPEMMMNDREVICAFMAPKPHPFAEGWPGPWWVHSLIDVGVFPRELDHNALWEVEEKLINQNRARYYDAELRDRCWWIWHAKREHKIIALAKVIREIMAEERKKARTK